MLVCVYPDYRVTTPLLVVLFELPLLDAARPCVQVSIALHRSAIRAYNVQDGRHAVQGRT